jgi:hypothetical protein|nr:MAG TPA: homing endonuclease [Caudoviricetes sp.]
MIIDFWVNKLGRSVQLDVSEDGKVIRDVERDYVYKQDCNSDGYLTVRVRHVRTTVHRLVALAFLGERPEGMVIDHIDRDKTNNHISNLRYCSLSENSKNISEETIRVSTERIVEAQKIVANARRGVRKAEWRF